MENLGEVKTVKKKKKNKMEILELKNNESSVKG